MDTTNEQVMEIARSPEKRSKITETSRQLRGSSLLLFGRFIALGINFAAQVLMVRYLTTKDYGSLAYALAIVAFFDAFGSMGLQRSISRFVPMYHEKREYDKLFGTIILVLATIAVVALVVVTTVELSPGLIARFMNEKGQHATALLVILIFLIPTQALDDVMVSLFASFASPRAIFFRRHVLGPVLRLAAVLLLIELQATVRFLAYGYLIASILGVLVYLFILWRLLSKDGLLEHFKLATVKIPFKEIFAFTIPLLTSDLVTVVMHSMDVMILGYFYSTTEIAMYRVVIPAVTFNKTVMTSFALLYTPLAARMLARGNREGVNELYWRTAVWMGVLTFPIFALTFSLAKPLTLYLYGPRYEASWLFLHILSFAYYFNVALGFNGLTLKVLNRLRYCVIINIGAVVANLILDIILIPRYGALGAALATGGAMVLHNIFKQVGLMATGVKIFERQYLGFYGVLALGGAVLFFFQYYVTTNIFIDGALAAVVSLLIVLQAKHQLKIEETFPEFKRFPVVRNLFSPAEANR